MAILLRSDVRAGDLPQEPNRSNIQSDVTTFQYVINAAEAVYNYCGKGLQAPGWAQLGFKTPVQDPNNGAGS
ncbi:MAG: hypothetical protein Q9219_002517 [cf. Caloplaca sp. 3 TL-2023]